MMWDDEAGYDMTDPKHPDWAGVRGVHDVDEVRKAQKERGPEAPTVAQSCPVLTAPGKVKRIRTRSTDAVVLAILRQRFPDAEIVRVA